MSGPDAYSWMLLLPVAFAGFILPGTLLTRLIPSSCVPVSSFLGSILILFWIVLGNQLFGLPLDLVHIAGGLGVVVLGLFLLARRKPPVPKDAAAAGDSQPLRADHALYLAAALLGLASILVRAAVDPLSGYDNIFRWNALSLEMLNTGSLSYYPAVSAEGFAHYAWCDGIAPLVSSLNFWLYLGTGSSAQVMTVTRIAMEAGLLFLSVFQFARVLWGSRAAGWTAMGMLATSSLALWAVAMGQETGLTALTLVAMLYFLHTYNTSRRTSDVIWAALAAAAGALSREYGLSYIIIGAAILLAKKTRRQDVFTFLTVAIAVSVPWHLRNAWITGNPLYNMEVMGLFPVNKVQKALMAAIVRNCSLSSQLQNLRYLLVLPPIFMGAVFLGALRGVDRHRLKSASLLFAGLVIGALWLWSIGQTAGGWVYSMRVLSPVIAIAAILAGNLALMPLRAGLVCAVAALAISADAARRSWGLPTYPLTTPWNLSFNRWTQATSTLARIKDPGMWAILCKAAGGKAIMTDHPGSHVQLRNQGGQAVPIFSPRADCMFDQNKTFAEIIAELRLQNIRFITMTESPINEDFYHRYSFCRELRQEKFKITTIDNRISIYDVEMIAALLRQTPDRSVQPR